MLLNDLYLALADTLDGELAIEKAGRDALIAASRAGDIQSTGNTPLSEEFSTVFAESDAHPVCKAIAQAEFEWAPPTTSSDPKYVAVSTPKAHVELIGPDGIVSSSAIRMGLYGMMSNHEYGIRTHKAEEVFVMLAGEADWRRGDEAYAPLRRGGRSYHPSMTPHAHRTRETAFMAIFVWHGDISTDSYVYEGSS